ncbi:MAG TPA: type II toxin-antitoxin system VapC family toxin [Thermoanaerobaculia bacterium]|nr:type II toxin-antitoxin system VapC family toxin [Thermoanaerobaculia bacterium]
MSVVVVDASVVIKWFVRENGTEAALRLFDSGHQFVAPDLLFAEVANSIWKKTLRGELTATDSHQLIADIERIAVETIQCRELATDAHALALITSRSVYDSMYVALAIRLETRLITADERLVNALAAFPKVTNYVELLGSS